MSRPEILFPLFAPLSTLAGIGPKTFEQFSRLCGSTLRDILFHVPTSLVDRRYMPTIDEMRHGDVVTCVLTVESYQGDARSSRTSKAPFKVIARHPTGFMELVFFHANSDYIKRMLPLKEVRAVSGKIERYQKYVQMIHPDHIVPQHALASICTIEPIYPLSAGISARLMQKTMQHALKKLPKLPEWIDEPLLKKHHWPSWNLALTSLHHPTTETDIAADAANLTRLAYDELLASQLALKLARKHYATVAGQSICGTNILQEQLLQSLPFELTEGQKHVCQEIINDQQSDTLMLRLLQGDVGSGKTVVALIGMLHCIEAGKQAALMAPTEVLAKQHMKWILEVTEKLPIKVSYLGATVKGKERKELLEKLANGDIHIIIGTHALFQEKVVFHDLGFAVIDEQHRFGVNQRMALTNKGKGVDTLLMTATPIPRTLTLAMYGDMACSRLTDKPQGRLPIDTRVMPLKKDDVIINSFQRVLAKKEKVYWICPLIEESEKIDLAAAEERYRIIEQYYPGKVGLLHGKMKAQEREAVMEAFKSGPLDILVATTVVEVGVDVKDATVIVIEHAELFGLAQLHQLRGRVGRSNKPSSCILLYQALNETSKQRLQAMRHSNDGFWLAEEDLKLRGCGQMLGVKQSGLPDFKFAALDHHYDLLNIANKDAQLILQQDPELVSPRGKALKTLLYLFDYDQHIKYLKAG